MAFERPIAQLAEAVEKDRPREHVARFAFVEKAGPPSHLGIAVPAEHEERSFYRPMSLSATASSFCRGYPDSFFRMSEAWTAPDRIEVARRRISLQLAAM